jgi:hypothetical protein
MADRANEPPGLNRVECTPGTVFNPGDTLPAPGANCVIVQFAEPGANNEATCVVEFSTPAATEGCAIEQHNVDGRNGAVVREVARQRDLSAPPFGGVFDQVAIQAAIVQQFNVRGDNDVRITQAIDQRIHSAGAATSPPHNIGAGQGIDLYQQGTSENRATVDEGYDQDVQNLGTQVSDIEVGTQGTTVFQCGAAVGLCAQGSARQTLHLRQSFSQALNAPQAVGGFQGQATSPFKQSTCAAGQTGAPDVCGSVNQVSGGVSRAFVKQKGFQRASAPKTSTVAERQDDPFQCCTDQLVNPSNHFEIDQDRTQLANSAIYLQNADKMEGKCRTSGRCAVHQRANQNGDVTLNSCFGSVCDILIICAAGGGPCEAVGPTPTTTLAPRRR